MKNEMQKHSIYDEEDIARADIVKEYG